MLGARLSFLDISDKNQHSSRILKKHTDAVKQVNKGVTGFLFLWLCGGLLYVLPNKGGAGLALPQNLMAWAVMALIALWCIYQLPRQRSVEPVLPKGSALIITGVVLWSLPLLWSPRPDWQLNAMPRVAALWGMAGLYILLLCTTSCSRLRSRWLFIIVVAALMQAGYALWQLQNLAKLSDGRPVGSFQQVNVLASFLATGLACALWLFLQSGERFRRYASGIMLFLIPVVLVILQSRAGNIGAFLSSVVILSLSAFNKRKQAVLATAILVAGTGIGLLWLYAGHHIFPWLAVPLAEKNSSTLSRLYILKLTWQMILMHPIAGNGYGSFEAIFGQLARFNPPGLEAATVNYPHNELLYAWVEGGLIAVAGVLFMVAGVLRRLWAEGGIKFTGVALLLPLAVHMNLEYPLYQSTTHCLLLVMLLVVCGHGVAKENVYKTEMKSNRWQWRIIIGTPVLAVLIFMITGLQSQAQITSIEEQNLLPLAIDEQSAVKTLLNPYSQFTRLDFDRHVALLMRFNFTRDPALLDRFREWAEDYLLVHNDPSVFYSLIIIARAQHRPELQELCLRAQGMWFNDPRFSCNNIAENYHVSGVIKNPPTGR